MGHDTCYHAEACDCDIAPDVDEEEYVATCPACGDPIDYCSGHGPIGDPRGARILARHDDGHHDTCHPAAECRQ